MPSVIIPGEMFNQLAKRAAALNMTVAQLITPLLDFAAANGSNWPTLAPTESPFDEWKENFDHWMADVQARAHRYPPGFFMNDSRESIYEGCGERL